MSEKFNGFSQEEINKVTANKKSTSSAAAAEATSKTVKGTVLRGQHNGIRRMPDKTQTPKMSSSTQTTTKSSAKATVASNDVGSKAATPSLGSARSVAVKPPADRHDVDISDVNLDCSMSKSIEEALFFQPMRKPNNDSPTHSPKSTDSNESSILQLPDGAPAATSRRFVLNAHDSLEDHAELGAARPKGQGGDDAASAVPADSLGADSPFRGISLKDFESHRKMIKEQNKQKKELLYKAIEHHSQKTAAEARKIEEIRHELAKLDNDLAVDVAIIRKQIDNACIAFATIEKQYMKIEAQFLKSKMELHNAAEKKELLTEHLCTVIAHNEDRKAEKLTELMQKVGISPTGDFVGVTEAAPTPNGLSE